MAWQLDKTVSWLGRYVAIKAKETQKRGKKTIPKWTLEQILSGKAERGGKVDPVALFLAMGADEANL